MGSGGAVKNLGVNGVSVTAAAGSASSGAQIGILAGYNKGTIDKCHTSGNVSASASSSYVGGLAGYSYKGAISNSYATGSASASSSDVSYAGGLAGYNSNGKISNSYAAGDVSATSASAIYVGGLAGNNDNGSYTNCYRNSDAIIKENNRLATPSDASIAGITPKPKAEMQTDTFKESLNGTSTVWGRSDSKNDKLPYIIGVGAGK